MREGMMTLLIVWFIVAPILFTALLLFGIVAFRHLPSLLHNALVNWLKLRQKTRIITLVTFFLEQQQEWQRTVSEEEKLLNVAYVLFALSGMVLLIGAPLCFLFFAPL